MGEPRWPPKQRQCRWEQPVLTLKDSGLACPGGKARGREKNKKWWELISEMIRGIYIQHLICTDRFKIFFFFTLFVSASACAHVHVRGCLPQNACGIQRTPAGLWCSPLTTWFWCETQIIWLITQCPHTSSRLISPKFRFKGDEKPCWSRGRKSVSLSLCFKGLL